MKIKPNPLERKLSDPITSSHVDVTTMINPTRLVIQSVWGEGDGFSQETKGQLRDG